IRPSSAAFDDDPDDGAMSVVLADVAVAVGRSPETVLVGHPGFALAGVHASDARECGQRIVRAPEPDEPAHALVFGPEKARKKHFRRTWRWVIPPPETTHPG